MTKTLAYLATQKRFNRNDILRIFGALEASICIEGFSAVLDLKESLGFERDEEPKEEG